MILVSVRTRPSNYPGDKYKNNINSGVFIGFNVRYDQLSGIIIQGFAAPGCHINQCLHLAVHQLYLFLVQGCQEAVTDFVQEYNMPFCEMTEGSFDFHIVKIPTIRYEINSLENSLQPSFK